MKPSPPKYPLRFLRWFCREDYIDEIEGDLLELFEKRVEKSPEKARWRFAWDVVKSFRLRNIKSFQRSSQHSNLIAMLQHTFLLAFRNFKRYKGTFLINLTGLSSGLTCVLLIYMWVSDELKIDGFFKNDSSLYQVMQNIVTANGTETIEATPEPLAMSLAAEYPEVAYAVSVIPSSFNASKGIVQSGDLSLRAAAQFVSEDFLYVFSYRLLQGNRDLVFSDKRSAVISDRLAMKLFNTTENLVGKSIEWKSQNVNGTCLITGVFESPPTSASAQFDLLLNYSWFAESNPSQGWSNSMPRTYLLLRTTSDAASLNDKLGHFLQSKDPGSGSEVFLQKYSDRYLYGRYENGVPAGGKIEYVRLFSLIALLIAIVACVNFMNLSTARASRRSKEVGIKKVAGARRQDLVFQYIGESMLLTLLSLMAAVLLTVVLLPYFSRFTGKDLALTFETSHLLMLAAILITTGLVAGTYPAFYLSGLQPVRVLKGGAISSPGGRLVRKGLVAFQFSVSMILMVAVVVVRQQVEYVQTKNLGFNREHVIYFRVHEPTEEFVSELKSIPGVMNVGGGNIEAGSLLGGTSGIDWEGKASDDRTFFSIKWVGDGLVETLGIETVEGDPFSGDLRHQDQIMFNETAIAKMGLEDPVGKSVTIEGEDKRIVGVIRDIHFESLYEEVKPCAMLVAPIRYAPRISLRIFPGNEIGTIEKVQEVFESHNPGLEFSYRSMEDDYEQLYASERRVGALSANFSQLAILISCLGLFGLTAFTIERRTKEIGIRKILGSGIAQIVYLLSSDILKVLLVAILVAAPCSYFLMSNWLDGFAYRTEVEWWSVAGVAFILLGIALAIVGWQALKAAKINPIRYIRYE